MASPLRPSRTDADGGGPESPEALVISALLEEGEFDPRRWKIDDDDLACFQPLWRFCMDHQQRAGRAPSFDLVQRKFPEFELTPDVDIVWAATKLREASANRKLRQRMQNALALLAEDDLEGAYGALDGFLVPVSQKRQAVDAFDHALQEEDFAVTKIDVPWPALGRVTGGIGPGEFWVGAARPEQGKTRTATGGYVPEAMRSGFNVTYFSLEMPAYQIVQQVNRALAHRDKHLLAQLDSTSREERKEALDTLRERVPGSLGVFDPSHGRCEPRDIRDALVDADLVVIDHLGLMTLGGKASISDWRIAGEISNKVKEECLRSSNRVLGLSQINRNGDTTSPNRVPRLSELTGTDAIGQDADVVITMNRFSDSVMLYSSEKNRIGKHAMWYSRFQPDKADFAQITRSQAEQLEVEDEDRRVRERE